MPRLKGWLGGGWLGGWWRCFLWLTELSLSHPANIFKMNFGLDGTKCHPPCNMKPMLKLHVHFLTDGSRRCPDPDNSKQESPFISVHHIGQPLTAPLTQSRYPPPPLSAAVTWFLIPRVTGQERANRASAFFASFASFQASGGARFCETGEAAMRPRFKEAPLWRRRTTTWCGLTCSL